MNQKVHYESLYEDQDQYWSTYDLGVSSCLLTMHFQILKIDRDNPKKARFIFMRNDEMRYAIENYYADKLSLNPRALFDSQKLIKSRLYSDI